jgi:small subunit ribosomal protein S8
MSFDFVQLIVKLKNASIIRKEFLLVEYSIVREDILVMLYNEGFLQSFGLKLNENFEIKRIWISLRYLYGKALFENLKLLSKPSQVNYMSLLDICNIPDRKFVAFFSTDKGLMTALNCKRQRVGGKALFIC